MINFAHPLIISNLQQYSLNSNLSELCNRESEQAVHLSDRHHEKYRRHKSYPDLQTMFRHRTYALSRQEGFPPPEDSP